MEKTGWVSLQCLRGIHEECMPVLDIFECECACHKAGQTGTNAPSSAGLHTCHDECPCHTGNAPVQDFEEGTHGDDGDV